jgi:hypothetical protein
MAASRRSEGKPRFPSQIRKGTLMSTARELLAEFFDCLRNLNSSVDRLVVTLVGEPVEP